MNSFLLYIDPGTGSMLFSIFIGLATTLYFVIKALFIKFKYVFSAKKDSLVEVVTSPIVIYNEGKQYCSLFYPILREFEKRHESVLYLTSYEDDLYLNQSSEYVKAEFIGKGNKAFAKLNFLSCDVLLLTTPGLDVYQLKKVRTVKHYSHIVHMPSDATTYRLFGLDYFDSVLLSGDYQKKDIQYLENLRNLEKKELVTVGCPYLDEAFTNLNKYEKTDEFTVLVSPTWGPSGLLSKYGQKLLESLATTGWKIIVRPHPQSKSSEADLLEKLTEHFKDNKNIIWDYEKDNMIAMSKSDIMISDFSGIIFDYVFLFNNPLLFVDVNFDKTPYDLDDLPHEAWQFETLNKIGVQIKEEDFSNIKSIIENSVSSEQLINNRQIAKSEAWMYQNESARRVVDFLISKKK